jgi:hypothetical protein
MVTMAADAAIKRQKVGLFTPEHKQLHEPYGELLSILAPVRESSSQNKGRITTTTSGFIDFWTLNDNELAGRGREYDLIMVDEGAFTKNTQMLGIWERSIRPTMLTRPNSRAWIFSTPNGDNVENFFWRVCNDPKMEFHSHYAPTSTSPFISPAELEREKERYHPLVFRQEFLAEFVDFSGTAFFTLDKLLEDGQPVAFPEWCEQVGLVIDTAVKGGKEHDGTAALWYAYTDPIRHPKYPLVVLDWDLVQIDGALLENLLPQWLAHGADLARECKALHGFTGAWIEDAAAGSILLQQAQTRGWPVEALPSVLTAAGKDARAINASGPVHRGDVKLSERAFRKNDVMFKGIARNHLVSQVSGFRIGDKAAATRADDLLDDFTCMVAVTLGDQEGIA